jgi:cell shape-determining protein MreC
VISGFDGIRPEGYFIGLVMTVTDDQRKNYILPGINNYFIWKIS